MGKTEKPNNSEPRIKHESDRKQHIGILEELKKKIEKESWTNFIKSV